MTFRLHRSARHALLATALGLLTVLPAAAQTPETRPNADDAGKVVAAGRVPDEAARAAILGRLRDLYGAEAVVDRLEVGGVVPPPNWTEYMTRLLGPGLKQVHQGKLTVNGTQLAVQGKVANEALRQQVVSDMATGLNPTYTVDNRLVVGSGQSVLDDTLSNRVVEFESRSANLTPAGAAILDEMAAAIARLHHPRLQVIGHTDGRGNRTANIELSLSRAATVRDYLVKKGIPETAITPLGAGPDRPVADNGTEAGRARNRRIEFRLLN
ncbi:MAG: OmpA family protein [Pseudomonadota bacterium]